MSPPLSPPPILQPCHGPDQIPIQARLSKRGVSPKTYTSSRALGSLRTRLGVRSWKPSRNFLNRLIYERFFFLFFPCLRGKWRGGWVFEAKVVVPWGDRENREKTACGSFFLVVVTFLDAPSHRYKRPSVRPSVRRSVPSYFRSWKVRILGASCTVYPALLGLRFAVLVSYF